MNRLVISIIAIMLCFVSSSAFSEDEIVISAFGDSLMAGYELRLVHSFTVQLEHRLKKEGYSNIKVIKNAVTGDTTADALKRFNEVRGVKPDIVLLEFGTNDTFQKVKLEDTKSNLEELITKIKQLDAKILLVRTKPYPFITGKYGNQYNKVYEEVAEKYDIPLHGNFLEGVMGKRKYNLDDMVHPNINGINIVVDNILKNVKILIEEVKCKCELNLWQKWRL